MGLLDDLKNSRLGRALSEKELEEREERYRLLTKPIVDKLETIGSILEPKPQTFSLSPPTRIFIPATVVQTNYRFSINKRFLTFVGLSNQAAGVFYSDPTIISEIGITVRFGNATSPAYSIQVGDTFAVNGSKDSPIDLFFTNGLYTDVTGALQWTFYSYDNPGDFQFENLPFRSFSGGASGLMMRGTVNANGDQYVLFRSPPSVTIPDTTLVKIWDGVSVMDVDGFGAITVNLASQPILVDMTTGAEYHQTLTAAAAAAVVMTITATLGDIRLNFIDISCYATAARAGGAVPTTITISGFEDNAANPVTLSYDFPTAMAIGTIERLHLDGAQLFRAIASTNIVITCPATAAVKWKVDASYRDI